jgi:ABC-type nitrate/sulfonate/bicarbonate transport system ATPase subunit
MSEVSSVSIEVRNIVQEYPDPTGHGVVRVLDDVSLHFDRPAINMLLGPSGCGKSTLLRMLGGVRPYGTRTPTSGQILIDGKPCEGPHDDAIMVFQQYANFPHLTVRENVLYPFRLGLWKRKVPPAEREARCASLLEIVGLADRAENRPAQLSGGQNQRLALAQALVLRPRILLMDEPFGALDAQTRAEMQLLLTRIWEEQKCLVLFVTHDITEALALGDRVTVLSTRPARVAGDFLIGEKRPRSQAWMRSAEAVALQNRVIALLRESQEGSTSLKVTL